MLFEMSIFDEWQALAKHRASEMAGQRYIETVDGEADLAVLRPEPVHSRTFV